MEEVRWRGKATVAKETGSVTGRTAAGRTTGKTLAAKFKVEWELLLWMIGSFAVLYFTDFASHLLFNPVVRRWWLLSSVIAYIVCVSCMLYSMRRDPTLNHTNWLEKAPIFIPMATITALTGTISLCIAVWPVWRLYTLLIIPILAMGFISTVSLFNI